jgi:hypothetical protein
MSCFSKIEMSSFIMRELFNLNYKRSANERAIHDEPERNISFRSFTEIIN